MLQDPTNLNDAQRKQLLQEGSEYFYIQMDAFLNFIRSACRAACAEERERKEAAVCPPRF